MKRHPHLFRGPRSGQGWANCSALLTIAALTVLGTACGKSAAKNDQAAAPAVKVKIEVAKDIPVDDASEYVATLKSRSSAVIMPEVEGKIVRIFVHSGQQVYEDTPLVQIDPAKQQATVKSQEDAHAAQQANLDWAQKQYDRISKLYEAGVSSKQEYDQARTNLAAAQAQLQSLGAQVNEQRVQLHYYKVVAPMAGIVGDIPVRVGDRVTTSTTLTTVDQPGSLEVYIYIPLERSSSLKMNLPVQIVDNAGNVIADSRISFISPEVDNTTQTILVKAQVANHQDRLRTAQFIRARVVWGTHSTTVVPILAVSRIGGQYFAFVADDQNGKLVAHQKPLKLGDAVGNNYVVLDGIKPGDKLIVSGTQFVVDGAAVSSE